MPRLRRDSTSGVVHVPQEFSRPDDPAWTSVVRTRDWLRAQGVEYPGNPVSVHLMETEGPLTRRRFAIEAWLLGNGCASDQWPKMLDWHKVGEMPLPRGWQSASVHERLANIGPVRGA